MLFPALSGPVLRDTARLSQRYPPIARYGVFGGSTWPIGCDTPCPFSARFPLREHSRSGGAIPPLTLKRGISAILARYPMKTRQKGAIPSFAILSRKGIARYGGVSRTGPLSSCPRREKKNKERKDRALNGPADPNPKPDLKSKLTKETSLFPEGPARHHLDVSRGKNCLPHCLEAIFDSQLPSQPNCLLKCLPNCLSPTREGLLASFKINPAVRVTARQVRDKNCQTRQFLPRDINLSLLNHWERASAGVATLIKKLAIVRACYTMENGPNAKKHRKNVENLPRLKRGKTAEKDQKMENLPDFPFFGGMFRPSFPFFLSI